jgi:hypothetical protein
LNIKGMGTSAVHQCVPLSGGFVYMCNASPCNAIGIGFAAACRAAVDRRECGHARWETAAAGIFV